MQMRQKPHTNQIQEHQIQFQDNPNNEIQVESNENQPLIDKGQSQFDPLEYRYPSLHTPASVYQKWERHQNDQGQVLINDSSIDISIASMNINEQQDKSTSDVKILTKEDILRRELDQHHEKMRKQAEELRNVIQPRTVGVTVVAQQDVETTESLSDFSQMATNYLHKVSPNDTLERICLIYNKSKNAIRKANDFMGDEIYFFKELIIPDCEGPLYENEAPKYTEEQRRKEQISKYNFLNIYSCLEIMSRTLMDKYRDQKSYKAEAQYYLDLTNYDLRKAFDEFDADLKFEQQQRKLNKKKKGGFFGLFKKNR
ncbi:UNKNOWN [Stylonychia lemnae]|uniref:LysM domain-containing protein n=1 Tax=Stylonychia lemnae TaxID=5949 RepID=A0A078AIB6_STYLE|nr:UNKNOWN [Stylonychia lemnae]|eukprot:CDW81247.1 UNKNOWN [Stylonychia lemnae]